MPTFHEQRSLSERLYEAQGINTQQLLGHSSEKMTAQYHNDRGLDWVKVKVQLREKLGRTPMQIQQNLKIYFGEKFWRDFGEEKKDKKPGAAPGILLLVKTLD